MFVNRNRQSLFENEKSQLERVKVTGHTIRTLMLLHFDRLQVGKRKRLEVGSINPHRWKIKPHPIPLVRLSEKINL